MFNLFNANLFSLNFEMQHIEAGYVSLFLNRMFFFSLAEEETIYLKGNKVHFWSSHDDP